MKFFGQRIFTFLKIVALNAVIIFLLWECIGQLILIPKGWLPATIEGCDFGYLWPDRQVGLWHPKNARGKCRQRCWESEVSFNSAGIRSQREYSLAKPPSVKRIGILGDSTTEGIQVNDNQVISSLLQDKLGNRYEVINFSVSSTGLAQHIEIYRNIIRKYNIDLLLYYVSSTDITDSYDWRSPINDPRWYHHSYTIDKNGNLEPVPRDMAKIGEFETEQKFKAPIRILTKTATFRLYSLLRSCWYIFHIDSMLKNIFSAQPQNKTTANRASGNQVTATAQGQGPSPDITKKLPSADCIDYGKAFLVYAKLAPVFISMLHHDNIGIIAIHNTPKGDFINNEASNWFCYESGNFPNEKSTHTALQDRVWRSLDIQYYNPLKYMAEWMKARGIYHMPFLSWDCDGHYSPMGQQAHADFAYGLIVKYFSPKKDVK